MKMFKCSVRLGGNVNHIVPKNGVSDLEIIVLRSLHGNDAVVDIKSVGESDVSKRDELQRLSNSYGKETIEELFRVKLDVDTNIVEDGADSDDSEAQGETQAAEQSARTPKQKAA